MHLLQQCQNNLCSIFYLQVEFVPISVAGGKQVVTIELKAEDVRLFSPEASQFINRVDLTGKYSPINEENTVNNTPNCDYRL